MLELQMMEFKKYFEKFDVNEENILRKYEHSIRVMNFAIEIAKSINLPQNMIEIVGIAGLLHDIGRFEQWTKYKTYIDRYSVDHGDLSAEILEKDNYIKNYNIDDKYVDLILKSAREHNKYKIADGLNFNEEIVTEIIRDADKIDILETQMNEIHEKKKFHKEYLENIYKNQLCLLKGKKTNAADIIIREICFIFDVNFKYTFKYIKDKKIIDKKFQLLKTTFPKNLELIEAEKEVNDYINKNL